MNKLKNAKTETMNALYFDRNLNIREVPVPVRPQGESFVRVSLAGICATDREIAAGYMSFKGIPGHEFVGIVEKSDNKHLIGKRVVGEINCGCGECEMCRSGVERHCPNRTTLGIAGRNGAFAEYLILPDRNLFEVPENIDNKTAVFTEPLAAAMEIFEQVKVIPSWKTLIIGDGKLSALIAQVFKLHSLDLTISGKSAEKLTRFENWGMNLIDNLTEPAGFDLVIEVSGSPDGWETAVNAVKPRGTIILKSTYHGNLNFNPAPLVIKEINLVGSRCGKFKPALRLLSQGLIDTESMINRIYKFPDIIKAIQYANFPETMKVLVEFA